MNHHSARSFPLLVLVAAIAVISATPPCAADISGREAQIKAAFIYNFIQFTEWPPEAFAGPRSHFVLGVFHGDANDPLPAAIDAAVKDKQVSGHRVVVRRFTADDQVQPCHALVFCGSSGSQITAARQRLANQPTLTIGETTDFIGRDGVIRLYREDNRIRFAIGLTSATKARVKISAKLLKLAKVQD